MTVVGQFRRIFSWEFWLDVRTIGFLLMVLAFGSAVSGYVRVHGTFDLLTVLGDFYANISAELGSIAVTVLIIDTVNRRYEAKQRIRDLQEELVRQAGSSVNGTAITAVDMIRRRGWLGCTGIEGKPDHTHAIVQNADLSKADLRGTDLSYAACQSANLESADMRGAEASYINLTDANLVGLNLSEAQLFGAIITDAKLEFADLSAVQAFKADFNGADLRGATLKNADLRFTDFVEANLLEADLSGSRLESSDLRGAYLRSANLRGTLIPDNVQLDRNTILPDGSRWSPERNLREFGAETRAIISTESELDVNGRTVLTYRFADGIQRRWRLGEGWLGWLD